MYSSRLIGAFAISALSGIAVAANPVLVDSAGSGDFTSVQAAISSWAVGGGNAGETAPFVIRIKAGSGPYDEAITLDPSVVGQGDIVGDIVIESDTSGTAVILKLQKTASTGAADDGLFINQNQHDVTFRDIIFTRSFSTPSNMPTDELVRVDESAANADMNLISFYNCIFTEPNAAGDPATMDKAGALPAPPTLGGPARIAGARLLQFWGDTGESNQLILDNCVFYGGTSTNVTARNDGAGAEFVHINNCLSTWAGFDCFNIGGTNPAAILTVTGTDQTAGPLNCTAAINPLNGGHCFTISGTTVGHTSNISKIIASSQGTASTPPGSTASRGVSGGNSTLTLTDAIINVPNFGNVQIYNGDSVWERVTMNTPAAAQFITGTATGGSLTVRDSIISGAGTKFTAAAPGGNTFINCAFPTSGPNAVGAVGEGTQTNVINDDPEYASLDGTMETFMDVQSAAYATAASGGGPLAGGADFIPPPVNPVLVDSAGSGDFTSVQAAISSWTTSGTNAAATPPFVIRIKAGSGPYDEAITLDPSVVGQGDIVGDIVIESDTSGTAVILKLQKTASAGAADDGLFINQNQHDVTFRDIIFTRSFSTPSNMPTDELVRVDESAANADMNLISFYNCIFTEPNAAGDPATMDKAGALPAPPTLGGPARIAGARLLQFWGDTGESNQLILDNCVFYGGTSTNVTARNDGAGAEFVHINNCLSTWAGFDCFNIGGTNPAAILTVTGTDQTAGPLNCTAAINPLNGGHCFTISGTTVGHTSNISKIIASSQGTASTPPGSTASRGVSGGNSTLTLTDAIINVPNFGNVQIYNGDSVWERVTMNTPAAAQFITGTATGGSLTVRDSIISGAGTKFTAAAPGGNTFINCAFPTSGPNAVGAVGEGTQTNVINDDPQYATLDGTMEAFMDVQNSAYVNAATGGAPLAGGADYIGGSSVSDWSMY